KLHDVKTGQEVLILAGAGECVAFSPDGKYLATGGRNDQFAGAVQVWDVASGQAAYALSGHGKEITDVAFSRDGQRLVTASGPTARLWDTTYHLEVLTLTHGGFIRGLAFSPADGLLATAGGPDLVPGTVKLWDGNPLDAK